MQVVHTVEAFAELTKAISKHLRGVPDTKSEVALEVADCLIVMDKMCHYFGITSEDIKQAVDAKTDKFLNLSCKPDNGDKIQIGVTEDERGHTVSVEIPVEVRNPNTATRGIK
jgi:hypothetical protein